MTLEANKSIYWDFKQEIEVIPSVKAFPNEDKLNQQRVRELEAVFGIKFNKKEVLSS